MPVERIWLDISENVEAAGEPEAIDGFLVDDLVAAIGASKAGDPGGALDGLLRSMRIEAPALRKAVLEKLGARDE